MIDMVFAAVPAALTATANAGPVTLRVPGSFSCHVRVSVSISSSHVGVTSSRSSPHAITAGTGTGSVSI
jgi:hypothetical protein